MKIVLIIACVMSWSTMVSANPIIIQSDLFLPITEWEVWTYAIIILSLEVFSVSSYLKYRGLKFLPTFVVLLVLNVLLFGIFSSCLIVPSYLGMEISAPTLYAEAVIVVIEATFILLLSRSKFFKATNYTQLSWWIVIFVSLFANTISAICGLVISQFV